MPRNKKMSDQFYDCEKHKDKEAELILSANEMVVINNALRHLLYDEDKMNELFCGKCAELVTSLLDDFNRELKHTIGEK